MLRREATTIKLTPEDILEYDNRVATVQQNSYIKDDNNEQDADVSITNYKNRNDRMGVQPRPNGI